MAYQNKKATICVWRFKIVKIVIVIKSRDSKLVSYWSVFLLLVHHLVVDRLKITIILT